MVERSEVFNYLSLFKSCIMLDRFYVKNRKENDQGMIELGVNAKERKEILLRLEPEDYVKGPEPDHMENDKDIWVFGKKHYESEIYIKMKIIPDINCRNKYRAVLWSFHQAKHKFNYPLADKGGK